VQEGTGEDAWMVTPRHSLAMGWRYLMMGRWRWMSLDVRHDRGSAAAPIAQFCAVPASAATTHLKVQLGGYLLAGADWRSLRAV